MTVLAFICGALAIVLGAIGLIRTRAQSLTDWGVVAAGLGLVFLTVKVLS